MSLLTDDSDVLRLQFRNTTYLWRRRPWCFVSQTFVPERQEFDFIMFADPDVRTPLDRGIFLQYHEAKRIVKVFFHERGEKARFTLVAQVDEIDDDVDSFFKPSYLCEHPTTCYEYPTPFASVLNLQAVVRGDTMLLDCGGFSARLCHLGEHLLSYVYDDEESKFRRLRFRGHTVPLAQDDAEEPLVVDVEPLKRRVRVFDENVRHCIACFGIDAGNRELVKFLVHPETLRPLVSSVYA